MALIFVLSAQPSLPRAPDDLLDTLGKKAAHFAEYLVLGALLSHALASRGAGWRHRLLAFVIAVAYAVSDEAHQAFVPGRMPSAWDVGIDAIGAASGVALVARWRSYTLKRTLMTSPSRTT